MRHPAFRRPEFFTGQDADFNATPDITWFDELGASPDWAKIDARIAARIDGSKADIIADRDDNDFYLIFNAKDESAVFKIGPAPMAGAGTASSTAPCLAPRTWPRPGAEPILVPQDEYAVSSRSFVLLMAREV